MNNSKPRISTLQIAWLGNMPYRKAWRLQSRLAEEIAAQAQPPTLLLLEHPHTYTLGRSGTWDHLLWSERQLQERGIERISVDRGGDITYHGPGQLVIYPILPLGQVDGRGRLPGPDYHGYLRRLEGIIARTVARWGLAAGPVPGLTGVWLNHDTQPKDGVPQPAKIAAIGVKVDANGVSRHGAALNVDPDMSYWQGIVPCGISQYAVSSMAEACESTPPMAEVRQEVIDQFSAAFACPTLEVEYQQLPVRLTGEKGTA